MFKGKIMNNTKQENINPKLVVRTRPTIKRRVVRDDDSPSAATYALVYGVCGLFLAGQIAYMFYTLPYWL